MGKGKKKNKALKGEGERNEGGTSYRGAGRFLDRRTTYKFSAKK